VHLGLEMPEEVVTQLVRVAQTALNEEASHRRVVVRLVLQHLWQGMNLRNETSEIGNVDTVGRYLN
jgi:hypothetical protein